jgi:hypothetical protein
MSHSIEWVQRKVIRKWKEQPPLSEHEVRDRQWPEGKIRWVTGGKTRRARLRASLLAGAVGLTPSYRPPTDPERGTHD